MAVLLQVAIDLSGVLPQAINFNILQSLQRNHSNGFPVCIRECQMIEPVFCVHGFNFNTSGSLIGSLVMCVTHLTRIPEGPTFKPPAPSLGATVDVRRPILLDHDG